MNWTTVALCQGVQIVQADQTVFFLFPQGSGISPSILQVQNYASIVPNSGIAPATLLTYFNNPPISSQTNFYISPQWNYTDGPYLDPLPGVSQTQNSNGMISSGSSSFTFTLVHAGDYTFTNADVNKAMRLWTQPPAWNPSETGYMAGDFVTYQGTYWMALVSNPAVNNIAPGTVTQPAAGSGGVPTMAWTLVPQQAVWVYGYVSALVSASAVTFTTTGLLGMSAYYGSTNVGTGKNGKFIETWQLGVYGGNGSNPLWPSCGCFHEGRIWLGGIPNRFDGCVSNGLSLNPKGQNNNPTGAITPSFSPTDQYGNVLDSSGISYTINSQGTNSFTWMIGDHNGIVCGTSSGEWLITASTLNDPLTPTSIQAHKVTAYKCAAVEPVRVGIALAFVQSFGNRLIEYVVDVFSQKFVGRHLNQYAKDLTNTGIRKIVYQEELAPVIWAVNNSNRLIGCTYRRLSHFGQEGPVFSGWHKHALGSPRGVQWICNGTQASGTQDVLVLLTGPDLSGNYHLETMQPLLEVTEPQANAFMLDSAYTGTGLSATDNNTQTITISGLPDLSNIQIWFAGLYCGQQSTTNGTFQVPYGSDPDGLLTPSYLQQLSETSTGDPLGLSDQLNTMYLIPVTVNHLSGGPYTYQIPCVIGYPYGYTFTLPRPQQVEQVRTQTGPGVAKTRRLHMYGVQFANTSNSNNGIIIQVDGAAGQSVQIMGPDGNTPLASNVPFSGVHWDVLDGDYSFDGQITVTSGLPYPMTVCSVTGFLDTEDR